MTLVSTMIIMSGRSQGRLTTVGQEIRNQNGKIILKGTNLGNWLITEGYMMDVSDKSHTDYWNGIAGLVGGQQKADELLDAWRANYITEADIDSIAASGYNSVRVPFHYNLFYDDSNNQLINDGFQYIDDLVRWCSTRGVYIILDMHAAPGGQNWEHHGDGGGDASLWSNYGGNKQKTVDIWAHISNHYKNEDWIAGYDMLNEPDMTGGDEWKLRDVYVAITEAIRNQGDTHIVFAEGRKFAVFLGGLRPAWDGEMVFSIHNYWEDFDPPQWNNQKFDAQQSNVPLWIGEFGENSNNWNNEMKQLCEDSDFGWCVWAYKKVGSMSNSMGVSWTSGYWDIKEYLRDGGDEPSQNDAYNDFLDFAQRTNIGNGDITHHHVDFDDALLRSDFRESPKAYYDVRIGQGETKEIPAWQYDMGANGVGSDDQVFEKTCNGCDAWNDGWALRCDGVDIKREWTYREEWNQWNWDTTVFNYRSAGNEWLGYTLNYAVSGNYRFRINSATGQNASIRIEVDGQSITKGVPNNGWGDYTDVIFNDVFIHAGDHSMKVYVASGNIDLRYLTVTNTSSSGVVADFVSSQSTGCVNGNIAFSSTSQGTDGQTNYNWSFGEGASPMTAQGAGPHAVTYSSAGVKVVTLNLNSGESIRTKEAYTVDQCVGLDGIELNKVQLYPNPALDQLNVMSDYSAFKVEIYDMSGLLMISGETSTQELKMSIQELVRGSYVVHIISNLSVVQQKLVKE